MNTRTVIGLLSLLYSVLQCQCYDPVSRTPASISSSLCQNSDLNFVNDAYVKPAVAVVAESPQPVAGKYWWLNKKSPFGTAAQVSTANVAPISSNEATNVKYESNPFINSFKESSCNGYSCGAKVPCVEEGYICAPQYLCRNGVINKNQLNQVPSAGKFCAASKEICCKISYSCEGNECYQNPGFTQTVAVISPYPPSLPPSVSVVSPSGYANPEYNAVSSISPAPTPAPTPVPYTEPQNSTPYPGCPAALKCVPDNYCTLEGVMSDIPVVLTKEALLNRVPLSECLDVATGIVGKCCRDPNYKDPWPDHDSHDHGHDHNHSHEHTEYNTEAPQTYYTIKKPVGGYSGSSSSGSTVNQHEVTNTYVPPSSSQVYIPPSQTYIPPQATYAPSPPPPPTASYIPPKPAPTYSPPQPVSSYIPPQPAPTYSPPQPIASYIPPQPASTYSPPQPVASYVPPKPAPTYSPPQPVVSYIPPTYSPQPVANYYVPPQQSQATGGSYYKPGTITLSRQPYEPPLFASDRVYEKSAISPFVTKQEYYSQCGVRANDGTEFGDAPWHAVIYSTKNKDLICGAAIVSENAILSSAHCVEKGDSDSLVVQAGPSSKVYKTAAIVRHPQYDSNTLVKDLALIVLKEAIKFDSNTQKICLPSPQSQEQSYNKECYLSTLSYHYNPASLQKLKIQTFHYKDCETKLKNTYLGKHFILNESFTCFSTPTESELCQVKSGEPVACDRGDGIYELYGIKSWDLGCQEYKKTAIFSNSDVQWIENTLVAPLEKLITIEQIYQREKFNDVNLQQKSGIAVGYRK